MGTIGFGNGFLFIFKIKQKLKARFQGKEVRIGQLFEHSLF
jgi:hypothetical protein